MMKAVLFGAELDLAGSGADLLWPAVWRRWWSRGRSSAAHEGSAA
jgi:hypothetical protein